MDYPNNNGRPRNGQSSSFSVTNGSGNGGGSTALSAAVRGVILALQTIRLTLFIGGIFYAWFWLSWNPTSSQTYICIALLIYFLLEQGVLKASEVTAGIRAARSISDPWDGKERRWRRHCPACHVALYEDVAA